LRIVLVCAALLAACVHAPIGRVSDGDPTVVRVRDGLLRGASSAGAIAWKNIPYAAPPIGDLRWKPPAAPATWRGVRDATGFGYVCLQPDQNGTPVGSEDCLTLNVWAPAERPAQPLPVLLFIHGGFEVKGSASVHALGVDLLDGSWVAAHGPAVVVTINYRLGPLGFAAHPALAAENGHHASGNYGLLDAIAALQWVQRNVGAFGGDPGHVLLFGHSAGAHNTCALLASPLAAGLFTSAMPMSGACGALKKEKAESDGRALATALRCDGADVTACMRQKSGPQVIAALPREYRFGGTVYGASVDGWVLPRAPMDAFRVGAHNHVPIVVGTTVDEMTTMIRHWAPAPIKEAADYDAALTRFFGERGAAFVRRWYPPAAEPDASFVSATSDACFICPARRTARALVAAQAEPVWRYSYAYSFPEAPLASFRAGHGLELILLMHHDLVDGKPIPEDARALAETMVGYWVRFAATGDPNGGDGPAWPRFDAAGDRDLRLAAPPVAESGLRHDACELWDAVEARRASR
jgi:para-nitrobenzyl esterase